MEPGYSGGAVPHPSYQAVCNGETGHAEVIRVTFDPAQITLRALIDFFWDAHDPTTLNRQGADVGTQYRSVIFYADAEQREIAAASKDAAAGRFKHPIVTEITALKTFFPAEQYHWNYYANNPHAPYCQFVIAPKLAQTKTGGTP